jgi:hypothetical protein
MLVVAMIQLMQLEQIQRDAEAMLRPLATGPASAITAALKPRPEDYAAVFVGDAATAAQQGYRELWSAPPRALGKPGQSEVHAFALLAEVLRSENPSSRQFPGGYRRIADQLQPDRVWVRFKYLAPGAAAGMSYDGLVHFADGHWAWFPKPWRVLGGAGGG